MRSAQQKAYNHDDIETANGYYDIETGKVNVEAEPKNSLTQKEQMDLLKELRQDQPNNSNVELNIELVDDIDNYKE